MKYKVINNHDIVEKTRAEYLFNQFCIDKKLDVKTFVHQIKVAYYKYDAPLYNPSHTKTISPTFQALLSDLSFETEPAIIDIGAGSGQSYELVKSTSLKFGKYYLIEPFQSMLDEFDGKNDDKVVLICDYFESAACIKLLLREKRPKIFMMCGVLRTLDNLNEFIDVLKENMKEGDKFILPLEPNNDYFGHYFKILLPLIFGVRVIKKVQTTIGLNAHHSPIKFKEKSSLDLSLEYLQSTGVVSSKFTIGMMYAIVNYNNFHSWRKIKIPEKYNDGFFTMDQVADRLGAEVTQFKTHTYLYGFSSGMKKLDNFLEAILTKLLPKKASTVVTLITKL